MQMLPFGNIDNLQWRWFCDEGAISGYEFGAQGILPPGWNDHAAKMPGRVIFQRY